MRNTRRRAFLVGAGSTVALGALGFPQAALATSANRPVLVGTLEALGPGAITIRSVTGQAVKALVTGETEYFKDGAVTRTAFSRGDHVVAEGVPSADSFTVTRLHITYDFVRGHVVSTSRDTLRTTGGSARLTASTKIFVLGDARRVLGRDAFVQGREVAMMRRKESGGTAWIASAVAVAA